jgi:alkylation response protein AidB-like acyl-CoA dehydrogenase
MTVSSESSTGVDASVATTPTAAEFVARAEALVPKLRERAFEAEQRRQLPDETIAELVDAEFHKILRPRRFGGYGLARDVSAEVLSTLASGDGSSGWISMVFITHQWQIGLFELETQEEIWGPNPEAFIATASLLTRSELTEVSGGYRLSGHWKFSSGSHFADWFMVMKPTRTRFDWMLIPRSEVTIVDDWYVSGMCATGSNDIILDDVFIPAHRTISQEDLIAGRAPGALVSDAVANAKLPFLEAVIFDIPSVIVGMGRGITECFEQGLVGKRSAVTNQLQIERVANQLRLAEAWADVDSAQAVMRNRLRQFREWDDTGVPNDLSERLVMRRDAAFVSQRIVQMATRLSLAAGASATYHKNPIQRFVRDILAGGSHAAVAWEEIAETYGRARWDLPPISPL